MQQIAEVAEGNWLDSLPDTMQEGVDKIDTVEAYDMMNGMCNDEKVKVNLIRGECQGTGHLPLE